MPDHRGDIRRLIYRTMNLCVKTEREAEAEIQSGILALGLAFVVARVAFLPGKGRWAEATALVNGQPLCVELLACIR